MTMRRDINVVGGTVDELGYDYSVLKQFVVSMQEQIRLQSVYNEYTETLRDVLNVAGTVLNIVGSVMAFASALSLLSLKSDSVSVRTYRTTPITPPGTGGGGGFPGCGGDTLHNLATGDIHGGEVKLQQFFPTTTTIENPALQSLAHLTATNLSLQSLNELSQIIQYSMLLTPKSFAIRHHTETPELITSELNFMPYYVSLIGDENTKNTITNTQQTLTKTHRKECTQTITDEKLEVKTNITVPQTSITKTTTKMIQLE